MTTASKITLVRVALIPVFMVLLLCSGGAAGQASGAIAAQGNASIAVQENAAAVSQAVQSGAVLRWAALAVFVLASVSDFVDGYIARHYNQVTDFGKFLDPLADKLLVTACMMIFVGQGRMESWIVFIVVAREFAVTGLRLVAVGNGRVIAAGRSGKVKTACTMVGLILMMAVPGSATLDLVVSLVILATTVYSGVEYFCKNWDALNLKA